MITPQALYFGDIGGCSNGAGEDSVGDHLLKFCPNLGDIDVLPMTFSILLQTKFHIDPMASFQEKLRTDTHTLVGQRLLVQNFLFYLIYNR